MKDLIAEIQWFPNEFKGRAGKSLRFAGKMAIDDMWRQLRVYREVASDPMLIYAATRRFVVVTA